MKIYHIIGFVVLYKTVWQALNTNRQAILRILCKKVNIEQFFLSYDNMNFYKKFQDQKFYNKNHEVVYTAGYMYFIKSQRPLFYHIVEYKATNKLKPKDFLLALTEFYHQTEAIRYILS